MKRVLLRSLIDLSGALLALGTAGIGPAQAASYAGGVDVPAECSYEGNQEIAVRVGTTAYDWRCVTLQGTLVGANIPSACNWQHGFPIKAIARIADFNNIYSWQCWEVDNLVPAGGLDLNSYCNRINNGKPKAVGSTAYDWRCVDSAGRVTGIDTLSACRAQYVTTAIDRFRNFYDRNSWECYV